MEYFRQRFNDDLNSNGPVEVAGFTWESAEVFQTMAPHDYAATVTTFVQDQIQQAKESAAQLLWGHTCLGQSMTHT